MSNSNFAVQCLADLPCAIPPEAITGADLPSNPPFLKQFFAPIIDDLIMHINIAKSMTLKDCDMRAKAVADAASAMDVPRIVR